MRRDFNAEKRGVIVVLIALLAADIVLAAYSWSMTAATANPQQELALQSRQRDLLKADIQRAEDIRQKMPAIQKDCDRFEQSIRPATNWSSAVTSELSEAAKKSGVHIEGVTFKPREISGRGISEVAIQATVNGEYASVVRFLNGLQRSHQVYVVDALTLNSETSNQGPSGIVKVNLQLKTYFRSVG